MPHAVFTAFFLFGALSAGLAVAVIELHERADPQGRIEQMVAHGVEQLSRGLQEYSASHQESTWSCWEQSAESAAETPEEEDGGSTDNSAPGAGGPPGRGGNPGAGWQPGDGRPPWAGGGGNAGDNETVVVCERVVVDDGMPEQTGWQKRLAESYVFLPRAPENMHWQYEPGESGAWFCLTGNASSMEHRAIARVARTLPDASVVFGGVCGTQPGVIEAARGQYPQPLSFTWWIKNDA